MSRKVVRLVVTLTLLSLVTFSAYGFHRATLTFYYPDDSFTDPCGWSYNPGSTNCVGQEDVGCVTDYKSVQTYNYNCIIYQYQCFQKVGGVWQQVTCP